jgi:hypothetical protein
VASRYDYQGLYNVYINIANGTYTENVVLPDFMGLRNNNTGVVIQIGITEGLI